jgi:hypothetical protein
MIRREIYGNGFTTTTFPLPPSQIMKLPVNIGDSLPGVKAAKLEADHSSFYLVPRYGRFGENFLHGPCSPSWSGA